MAHLRGGDHNKAKKRTWTEAASHSDVMNREFKGGIGVFGRASFSRTNFIRAGSTDRRKDDSSGPVLAGTMPALQSVLGNASQADFTQNPVNLQPQIDMFLPSQEDDDLYTPSLFLRMNFCRYPPSADLGLGVETATAIETMGLQHTL